MFAAVTWNDRVDRRLLERAESAAPSAARSLSGSIVRSSRSTVDAGPERGRELLRRDRERGTRSSTTSWVPGEQLASARAAARRPRPSRSAGSTLADGQRRRVACRSRGAPATSGVRASSRMMPVPPRGSTSMTCVPLELQVAFDAAGRGLALPPVEDAVEPGLAVVDRAAGPRRAGTRRSTVPSVCSIGFPLRPARRAACKVAELVDVDLEDRRIGDDLTVAERRPQRLRSRASRGERGDLGVRVRPRSCRRHRRRRRRRRASRRRSRRCARAPRGRSSDQHDAAERERGRPATRAARRSSGRE